MQIRKFLAISIVTATISFTTAQSMAAPYTQASTVTQLNDYSLHFLQSRTANQNQLASPLSLAAAFALLYPGTSGKLHTQLNNYFNYGNNIGAIATIENQINHNKNIQIANSLWIDNATAVKATYQDTLKQLFNSTAHRVNFNNQKHTAAQINHWVASKTNNFLQKIITPKDIKNSNFALVNAIYFHGKWQYAFHKDLTKVMPFHVNKQSTVNVNMMHQMHTFNYYANQHLQMVMLPYKNHQYNMIVLLPKQGTSMQQLQQSINTKSLKQWQTHASYTDTVLALPRFSYNNKMYLKQWLQHDGLTAPFKASKDFQGITPNYMQIKKVIQAAKINVNEQGTKAAAATIAIGNITATASPRFPRTVFFNANHPFIYLIQQKDSGLIVFSGIEHSPNKATTA